MRGAASRVLSVTKMAHARKHHRQPALVGGRDHFRVAHAAAGLDHRGRAVVGNDVEAVAKWEERVRRHGRPGERKPRGRRLDRRDFGGIDAALKRAPGELRGLTARLTSPLFVGDSATFCGYPAKDGKMRVFIADKNGTLCGEMDLEFA